MLFTRCSGTLIKMKKQHTFFSVTMELSSKKEEKKKEDRLKQ